MSESVEEYLDGYVSHLRGTVVTRRGGSSASLADGVADAIALVREARARGSKMMFIGNGGSAAIASHSALDFWHVGEVRAVSFDGEAQLTCMANDYGFERVFSIPIETFSDEGDILVAISSSGESENIVRGVEAARSRACAVVTLSGFSPDNRLRTLGDLNFHVPVARYVYVESIHGAILHMLLELSRSSDG
jgi:D-sedoheptulose 7-phosphate isomerase